MLPQNRAQLIHGVEDSFRLDVTQPFKNPQVSGWTVFLKTWPSSTHGIEYAFRLNILQAFKILKSRLGRAPPYPTQLISRC